MIRAVAGNGSRVFSGVPAIALVVALGSAMLAGCSTVGAFNAIQPRSSVHVTRDLRYQAGDRGTLDIYRPVSATGHAPVVLFLYGGSWESGNKHEYAFVGDALASAGIVTIIPDYRLYPEVRWPSFLEDNARALRWAVDHAAEYGGDPRDLILMGHSAGAYDALMLALDTRWLAAVNLDPTRALSGVIGLAGPYDFLPLTSSKLQIIFGPPQGRPATQPINYVTGHNPPLLLATDTADKQVDPGNTTRLAAKVRAAGGSVQVQLFHHVDHALLLGALGVPLRFLAPVRREVLASIRTRKPSHAADTSDRASRP